MSNRPRLETLPQYGDVWCNHKGATLRIGEIPIHRPPVLGRLWQAYADRSGRVWLVTEDGLAEAGYRLESRLSDEGQDE